MIAWPVMNWTRIYVSLRDGSPSAEPLFHTFPSIPTCCHPSKVDLLSLEVIKSVSARVQLVRWQSRLAIIKFARFEYEQEPAFASSSDKMAGGDIGLWTSEILFVTSTTIQSHNGVFPNL